MGQNAKHSNRANAFRFTPELGHCSEQLACLKGADAVEKVFWGDIRKFSKATDAFYARRRVGPHRVSEKRPRTFVSALRSIAAAE